MHGLSGNHMSPQGPHEKFPPWDSLSTSPANLKGRLFIKHTETGHTQGLNQSTFKPNLFFF